MSFPSLRSTLLAAIALLATPALAERLVWVVPGTLGTAFEGLGWDAATGRIVAASGDTILRIDPASGERATAHCTAGHRVLALVVGPEGIDFLQEGKEGQRSDGQVRRLDPGGEVRVIAGRGDEGPFVDSAEDAREARFRPFQLAIGPGGRRYVADWEHDAILLLEPTEAGFRSEIFAGRELGDNPGYDPEADDQDIDRRQPKEFQFLDGDSDPDPDPMEAAIKPWGLAALPHGPVFVADWSDLDRPPQVIQVDPEADPDDGRRCFRLPVPGQAHCQCPPGQEQIPVRKPRLLAAGADGTLYVLGSSHLWAYSWLELDEDGEAFPVETWRREAVAGLLAPKAMASAWPPQGTPADQLDPAVLSRVRHLAALPDGSLLLSDGLDGIRCIGPENDGALAGRVREHARIRGDAASAGGPAARARELDRGRDLLERLEEQRDALAAGGFDLLPFRALCKDRTVDPRARLPEELLEHIASFLVAEPRILAFRATMAAQAIRAGADPGPDPGRLALALRHAWLVPGSVGMDLYALRFDPRDLSLVAADGLKIRRLDPIRGGDPTLLASAAAPGDGPEQDPRCWIHDLAVGPDGRIEFTLDSAGALRDPDAGLWRLEAAGGSPRRLISAAGFAAGALAAPDGGAPDRLPLLLGVGPDGARYVLDGEHGRLLQLTEDPGTGRCGLRLVRAGLGRMQRMAVSRRGEVVLGSWNHHAYQRLLPPSGAPEPIPGRGQEGCPWIQVPGWADLGEEEPDIFGLAAGRDGAFFAAENSYILEYVPEAGTGSRRWRCHPLTVSSRNAVPAEWLETDSRSSLPALISLPGMSRHLDALPGGGLAVGTRTWGHDSAILFFGPPGDGALFQRVEDFHAADRAGNRPRAQRILRALVQQRQMEPREVCDLPFLALAARSPGRKAPRMGPLSLNLQREVGSWLVRPREVSFRAALAVAAITEASPWAKAWVAAGCPVDPAPAAGPGATGPGRRQLGLGTAARAASGTGGAIHKVQRIHSQ